MKKLLFILLFIPILSKAQIVRINYPNNLSPAFVDSATRAKYKPIFDTLQANWNIVAGKKTVWTSLTQQQLSRILEFSMAMGNSGFPSVVDPLTQTLDSIQFYNPWP